MHIYLYLFNRWNYVVDLPEAYTPMAHGDLSEFQNALQSKKIINQSDHHLTGRETEVLALGLDFCPRIAVAEYATSLNANPNVNSSIVNSPLSSSSSVRSFLHWETLPSVAPGDRWPIYAVNEVYKKIEIVEPSGKYKRRRESNSSDCSMTSWKRKEKRYHTSPNQITMDCVQVAAVANMWREQNLFYLTESDHLPGDAAGVLVLWSREHYQREAERHFVDDATYELIAFNGRVPAVAREKMAQLVAARDDHLQQLRDEGVIGEETLNELQNSETNQVKMIPFIHFRPKIDLPAHRKTGTFQARAVVDASSGPLHALDEYLAKMAAPITRIMPGILNESYELVQMTSWLTAEAQNRVRLRARDYLAIHRLRLGSSVRQCSSRSNRLPAFH